MADSSALITELSRRLRDPNNEQHARTLVRDVLSQCQRIINLSKEDAISTVSFTPTAERTFYRTSEVASDVAKIVAIRQSARDLYETTFGSLSTVDTQWLRRTGQRYEAFARIGGSLFALYPALASPLAISVVYVIVPGNLTDGAGDVSISDKHLPLLLDMGELVLSARVRTWEAMSDVVKRVSAGLGMAAAPPAAAGVA